MSDARPLPFGRMSARNHAKDREPSELGRRILDAAKSAGYSPTKLERKLVMMADNGEIDTGFSQGYMSRLIYGQRGNSAVDPKKLQAISDATRVNFEWLATGREPRAPTVGLTVLEEAVAMARRMGAREDAIALVLAASVSETDLRYIVESILQESDRRLRSGIPAFPSGDGRRQRIRIDRAGGRGAESPLADGGVSAKIKAS